MKYRTTERERSISVIAIVVYILLMDRKAAKYILYLFRRFNNYIIIIKKSKFDKPLICFCVVNFLLNAAVSIITPFYPPLAEKAGFSVATISYIFAV